MSAGLLWVPSGVTEYVRRRYRLGGVQDLAGIRHFVEEAALAACGDAEAVGDLVLAVNEAVTNIVVHGYENEPGELLLEIRCAGGEVEVCLEDQAPVFDPTSAAEPDLTLPLEQRPPGGAGILMMREYTDEMHHVVTASGCNRLTLIKRSAEQD
jgi:serine/threonine-protein kinase RsbW